MQTHSPPWKNTSETEKDPSPFVFSQRYCGNKLKRKRAFYGRGEQGWCLSKAIKAGVLNSPSTMLKIEALIKLNINKYKKKIL